MINTTSTTRNNSDISDQNYPFTDTATLTSETGVFVPPTVFKDARVFLRNNSALVYISKIKTQFNKIEITIQDNENTVATATVSDFSQTFVPILDTDLREVGVLLLNPLELRAVTGTGRQLEFNSNAMPFVASVMFPQVQNVVRSLVDSKDKSASGDVWLIGEDGVVLRSSGNTVTFHVVGDPYFLRKLCERAEQTFAVRRPLKSLRVVSRGTTTVFTPDAFGNVNIQSADTAGSIIRVTALANGIQLSVVSGS